MAATCNAYYQGLVARATRLDACGAVVPGVCGYAVTKGFVSIELETDEEDGETIAPVLANGERCYFRRTRKNLNGHSVSIEFCEVDPEFFELMTGITLILDDAVAPVSHGFAIDSASYAQANVALEIWTNIARSTCTVGGSDRRWGYVLLPWLEQGSVSLPTIENGAVNFTISGAMTRDGNQWGVGPYDIQLDNASNPSPLFTAITSTTHSLEYKVNLDPPTPTCGCQTLTPVT